MKKNLNKAVFLGIFTLTSSSAFACIPIDNSSDSRITSPGNYCVVEDLNFNQFGYIEIRSSDVVIDFQGHTLKGPGHNATIFDPLSARQGIYASNNPGFGNIHIKNGTISGFDNGVYLNSVADTVVENMLFTNITTTGVLMSAKGASALINNRIHVNAELNSRIGTGNYSNNWVVGINYACSDKSAQRIVGNQISKLSVHSDPQYSAGGVNGIRLQTCHKTEVKDNLISGGDKHWSQMINTNAGNDSFGMYIKWSRDTVIENNKFINFQKPFRTYDVQGAVAYDNYIRDVNTGDCCFQYIDVTDGGGNRIY